MPSKTTTNLVRLGHGTGWACLIYNKDLECKISAITANPEALHCQNLVFSEFLGRSQSA